MPDTILLYADRETQIHVHGGTGSCAALRPPSAETLSSMLLLHLGNIPTVYSPLVSKEAIGPAQIQNPLG